MAAVLVLLGMSFFEIAIYDYLFNYSTEIVFVKLLLVLLLISSVLSVFIVAYFLPPPVIGNIVLQKECLWVGNKKYLLSEIELIEIKYDGAKYDLYFHGFLVAFVSGKSNCINIYKTNGEMEKISFFVKKKMNFYPSEEIIEYWNQTYHNITYMKHQEQIV